MSGDDVVRLLEKARAWASQMDSIKAIGLAGSHAREDSDVDLVILCDDYRLFLNDLSWIPQFGVYPDVRQEDWGAVQSVRVFFSFAEVEFGFAHASWACTDPLDAGTAEVLRGGFAPVYDPDGVVKTLIEADVSS